MVSCASAPLGSPEELEGTAAEACTSCTSDLGASCNLQVVGKAVVFGYTADTRLGACPSLLNTTRFEDGFARRTSMEGSSTAFKPKGKSEGEEAVQQRTTAGA